MKQVEETLQPIANDTLRGDSGYVHAINHILGLLRRRGLSDPQGMVQLARSRHPLSARLDTDVQRRSSRQCQYNLNKSFFFTAAMYHPHDLTRSLISVYHHRWRCCLASLGHLFRPE